MLKEFSREKFWELYKKLPEELREAIWSEKTTDDIYDICQRNGIKDNQVVSEIIRFLGQVLLGVLPPEDFQASLEKELKLEKDLAKKVAREIFRFIFYPVKTSLEELYEVEIAPPAKPTGITPPPEIKPPTEEKPEGAERDTYREPIE